MTVLALIECLDHVCYRYRIAAFATALAERGLALEAEPLQRGSLPRWRQFLAARRAAVVVLQRKLLPLAQTWLLRKCARRLIYDFDDAMYQRDSFSRKAPQSRSRTARFRSIVDAADAVLAGNPYLAAQAAAHVDAAKIHVVPTCVDPSRYLLAQHTRRGVDVRLVWIGSRSTLQGLQRAAPWLEAVGRRLPQIKLRLICDATLHVPGLQVFPRSWSSDTECQELAAADVGISWLPDDSFTRGKCGLKVLQYMAAGLPVVTNPVGVHLQMVIPGETGYLPADPHEWAEAIARLAANPALRQRMGQAGRQRVEELYGVDRWAGRFADLVAGTAAPARRAG